MTDEEYPDYLEELDRKTRNLLYLKELRYAAGWSRCQLAILLDCTQSTCAKIEQGCASRMQYLAVRSLLDDAAKSNPFLARAIEFFIDDKNVTELQKREYESYIELICKDVGKRDIKGIQQALENSAKPWETSGYFNLNTYRLLNTEEVPGGIKYVLKDKRKRHH